MHARTFLKGLSLVVGVAWFAPAMAMAQSPGEKEKIEALIRQVENLGDAKFIRNGKSYDSKDAAKFLRGKWQSKEKEIQAAGDFIDKVASVSSTTGQPYLIRFSDGREVKCADYLKELLKKTGE